MSKPYYQYYQLEEKGAWIPVESAKLKSVLQEQSPKRVTILEMDELVTDDSVKEPHEHNYRGPLYFDLDCKGDIPLVAESAVELIEKLEVLGVPKEALRIYASGSKGVHIIVPQSLFLKRNRGVLALPYIYREMARELYVAGLDYQVYSAGRGVAWREPNKQRDDGRYRVPIKYEELAGLTNDNYVELCQVPRLLEFPEFDTKYTAPGLIDLFERAKAQVAEDLKRRTEAEPINEEEQAILKEEVPACVKDMAEWRNIRPDKSFNMVATQVALYMKASACEKPVVDSLIAKLADNGESSSRPTVRDRRNHVRAQRYYVNNNKKYQFSCSAMRATLTKNPCKGCPLDRRPANEGGGSGLVETDLGIVTFDAQGKRSTLLANFTLRPVDSYVSIGINGDTSRRDGVKMEILKGEEVIAVSNFSESSWSSRSAFVREVEGYSDLVFYGGDRDVQRIKHMVMGKSQEISEVTQVPTLGIHIEQIQGRQVNTYVEPSMSINSNKITNTFKFKGRAISRPYLFQCQVLEKGDAEADKALSNMAMMNAKSNIAAIIGWFAAAHLKAHLMHIYKQFPILSVAGNANSGKTMTVDIVAALSGMDLLQRDSAASCPNMTPYAITDYACSTTTVPRVFEEYNKSKIRRPIYNHIGEILKASWNGDTTMRGGVARKAEAGVAGGATYEQKVTAPLVVISEQDLQMPALQHRAVRIHLSREDRRGRAPHLVEARKGIKKIQQFGKSLMIRALQLTTEEVEEMLEAEQRWVSMEAMEDRPRFGCLVALMGLSFARSVALETGLPQFAKQLEQIKTGLIAEIAEGSSATETLTEVDSVLEDLAMMASLSNTAAQPWLNQGIHYVATEDFLFIDPKLCHSSYRRYMSQVNRDGIVIDSARQFEKLLGEELYYVDQMESPANPSIKFFKLNKTLMLGKGIDVNRFEVGG